MTTRQDIETMSDDEIAKAIVDMEKSAFYYYGGGPPAAYARMLGAELSRREAGREIKALKGAERHEALIDHEFSGVERAVHDCTCPECDGEFGPLGLKGRESFSTSCPDCDSPLRFEYKPIDGRPVWHIHREEG